MDVVEFWRVFSRVVGIAHGLWWICWDFHKNLGEFVESRQISIESCGEIVEIKRSWWVCWDLTDSHSNQGEFVEIQQIMPIMVSLLGLSSIVVSFTSFRPHGEFVAERMKFNYSPFSINCFSLDPFSIIPSDKPKNPSSHRNFIEIPANRQQISRDSSKAPQLSLSKVPTPIEPERKSLPNFLF
jgi:hypothetical protein